jgi:intracellular sulfur oxidation DsrE/DsrF family protein
MEVFKYIELYYNTKRIHSSLGYNALKANDIKSSSLLPFITIVPAGVVEIAMKQQAGYSYIKP